MACYILWLVVSTTCCNLSPVWCHLEVVFSLKFSRWRCNAPRVSLLQWYWQYSIWYLQDRLQAPLWWPWPVIPASWKRTDSVYQFTQAILVSSWMSVLEALTLLLLCSSCSFGQLLCSIKPQVHHYHQPQHLKQGRSSLHLILPGCDPASEQVPKV